MTIDDEDLTPQPPPVVQANYDLLSAVSDLILALHHHLVRLRQLAREVRVAPVPVGPELRGKIAGEIEAYHGHAGAIARRLRQAG